MRRIQQKAIHEAALKLQLQIRRAEGIEVRAKSLERKLRKATRRHRQTANGRTSAARAWPAKPHDFDRCANCRRAKGKA